MGLVCSAVWLTGPFPAGFPDHRMNYAGDFHIDFLAVQSRRKAATPSLTV